MYLNCPYCGRNLSEPTPATCPNCGRNLQTPSYYPEEQFQSRKGLGDLRNGFLLYLIAALLSFVPIIGGISSLLILVALILFIIGWRALGRSSFGGRSNYRSTGNWLIYAIILIIVAGIIGVVAIMAQSITYFVSNPITPPTNSTSIAPLLQNSGYRNLLVELFGLIAALVLLWDGTWIKMCFSIRKLGRELSETRLRTAGSLYISYAIFGIATGIGTVLILLFGKISVSSLSPASLTPISAMSGLFSYFVLGGYLLS